MAQILDGKVIAQNIKQEIRASLGNDKPKLAIVVATNDESTASYTKSLKNSAEKVGIKAEIIDLGGSATQEEMEENVSRLGGDTAVNGIILQTPLPNGVDASKIRELIPAEKDVDGANALTAGRLFTKQKAFAPATAQAVIEILKYHQIEVAGKHAVVVGRSNIVGKPVANMLVDLDATVTICHSKTPNLEEFTKQADILVVAAGKIDLITPAHINPAKNTVVIDVGTNFSEQKMFGDVNFIEVEPIVSAITPVPGGVGPVTTAILLKNSFNSYLAQKN